MATVAGCACLAVWMGDPTTPGGYLPACPTKLLLGIDCPGCGSLRMIYSVLHGDLLAALRFNAVGLIALGLLVWAYLAWTYGRMRGRRIVSWQHHRCAAMVTLVVTVVWFIIRNLPLDPFTALRV
nr:DUF2752 domain-containing protein [Mycolicibacterium fortuitum]